MDIIVRWDKMGPEFSYHVWHAKNPKGPWIRDNSIRLTDDVIDLLRGLNPANYYGPGVEYNEYRISDLDKQTRYSVKVTSDDRYDAWWYSYDGPRIVSGGLNEPHVQIDPDDGNLISFQFTIG